MERLRTWLGLPEEARDETDYWLVLARLSGPSGVLADAIERVGSARGLFESSTEELLGSLQIDERVLRRLVRLEAGCDIAREREAFARCGASLVTTLSPDYPDRLRDLPDRPISLFVQGDPALLSRDAVAMVGSRNASESALTDAEALAARLTAEGFVVVSGFAVGIDAASHNGALRNGSTVAVLGCGIDIDYPRANAGLRKRILERGAVATELPIGGEPRRYTFPRRNRLIAALSLATVVAGAGEKSGALLTVEAARKIGRPVGAVPADIRDPRHRGVLGLLQEGVRIVESADDVLAIVGKPGAGDRKHVAAPRTLPPLSPDEAAALRALDHEPLTSDDIAERAGLGAAQAATALLLLEVKGCVTRHGGGRYSLGAEA